MGLVRLCLGVLSLFLVSSVAHAAVEVTVDELIENSPDYAGVHVLVEGELVNDYGFRRDGWMWTQLNGDVYAWEPLREGGEPAGANSGIGVRMPHVLGEDLDPPGGYRQRGPIVRVEGVWRHNDPERQGETFLQIESLTVVEPGRPFRQDMSWPPIIVGAILIFAAGLVWKTRPR